MRMREQAGPWRRGRRGVWPAQPELTGRLGSEYFGRWMANPRKEARQPGMDAATASPSAGGRVRVRLVIDNDTRYGGNVVGDGSARKDEPSLEDARARRVCPRPLTTKRSPPLRPDFSTRGAGGGGRSAFQRLQAPSALERTAKPSRPVVLDYGIGAWESLLTHSSFPDQEAKSQTVHFLRSNPPLGFFLASSAAL